MARHWQNYPRRRSSNEAGPKPASSLLREGTRVFVLPEFARLAREDLIVTTCLAETPDDIAALRELLDEADRLGTHAIFVNLTAPWCILEARFFRDIQARINDENPGKVKDPALLRGTVGACIVNADLGVEEVLDCSVALRCHGLLDGLVAIPCARGGTVPAHASYTVRTNKHRFLGGRLRERGIPTSMLCPRPLHKQVAYQDFAVANGSCPVAEHAAREVLSVPMHPNLAEDTQQRICAAMKSQQLTTSAKVDGRRASRL
ncbi:Uncharacterized protein TPAR_08651 [Tolypocladium paradoxum]|uniref:Uncharacterized protein n=1 Tax=Tolypocladium paradoxum TaxID=94208 RepID=A0A2S4KLT7_9HYPO|nr:Uncharacterized protein TPAR_08651 [Tolypocladium paradoxum]